MAVRLPDDHWGTRSISCYEKVEQIGEGTYGQVCRQFYITAVRSLSISVLPCTTLCSTDGTISALCPRDAPGVQGKEQGDERCRRSQEDSGAQREFWSKFHVHAITIYSSVAV